MTKLGEAINEWMVKYKRNSIKPASFDRMLTTFNLMTKYKLAYIEIDVLTTDDIQDYLNELAKDGYALSTIKKQFNLISGYMTYANLRGDILKPLHKGVKLPSESSVKKSKKEVIAYNKAEQIALTRVLQTKAYPGYCAALLMLETGMRVGEVLALTWGDIDWNRKAVKISKTLVRLANKKQQYVQNAAKSFTSNRTIPLSSTAYSLLESMYESETNLYSYVFHDSSGDLLSYEAMRWQINKACDIAGVRYLGQHVFRHTFATNCYARGCDVKVLSKLLGHSDVTITYNIYIHLFGDALEEMRKVIG